MRRAVAAIAVLASVTASVAATGRSTVGRRPVVIGQYGPDVDACQASGRPRGLDPRGDNWLAVKLAPAPGALRVDRLSPGQMFWICGARAGWTAIVYAGPGGRNEDCGVSTPVRTPRPYDGPCRSGWVSSRYVQHVAG